MISIWTKNNRACTALWTSLYGINEISSNFSDSGDLNIRELAFYDPLTTRELRQLKAMVLAKKLDNIFMKEKGTSYENDCDRAKALGTIAEVLMDENKLLSDLAAATADCYLFWQEMKVDFCTK